MKHSETESGQGHTADKLPQPRAPQTPFVATFKLELRSLLTLKQTHAYTQTPQHTCTPCCFGEDHQFPSCLTHHHGFTMESFFSRQRVELMPSRKFMRVIPDVTHLFVHLFLGTVNISWAPVTNRAPNTRLALDTDQGVGWGGQPGRTFRAALPAVHPPRPGLPPPPPA